MRIGGIASGLDTNQLIADLMRAERMPLHRIEKNRIWLDWKRDAYREVNLALTNFRNSYEKLRLQGSFNSVSAQIANSQIGRVTASSNAVQGNYTLQVDRLAKAATVNSANAIRKDVNGPQVSGTDRILEEGETASFVIRNGAGKEALITVNDQTTYAGLASLISNAVDDEGKSLGFRASFDNTTGRFFFSTREMGEDQRIIFEESSTDSYFVKNHILNDPTIPEDDLENGLYEFSGQNALIYFNNIEVSNLRTNNVSINGLQINLLQTGTTTISVQSDVNKTFDMIKDFVDSYNALIQKLEGKLNEPRHRTYQPLLDEERRGLSEREAELWDEKAKSGLLRNDNHLRNILANLRRGLSDPVQGIPSGDINTLSQIGITTGNFRLGGQLFIDENKLREALREQPDQVMTLFTRRVQDGEVGPNQQSSSFQGLGFRLQSQLNQSINTIRTQAGTASALGSDKSILGRHLRELDDRIQRFNDRLIQIEDRYWRQFTAMERAMNELNSQSLWMMQTMFGGFHNG